MRVFWIPADSVGDAWPLIALAAGIVRTTWTRGPTDHPASGHDVRRLRGNGYRRKHDLHLRVIFESDRDAMLFRLTFGGT